MNMCDISLKSSKNEHLLFSWRKTFLLKIISSHPVDSHYTYGAIALVALFPFICTFEYPRAASQTWFSQSERRHAALRVFPEIQFVPLRVFPTFFLPPHCRVHSEKYIRRENERVRETDTERKKVSQAARGVHAELFKWAALGGARNSVKFRAKREKSRGRIGLREFWNPRLYEW